MRARSTAAESVAALARNADAALSNAASNFTRAV
jgi:hypothetical protein